MDTAYLLQRKFACQHHLTETGIGKETIDSFNTSETRGRELSHGLNYQKLGKELMTQDEIAVMDGGKCILQVRGV